MAGEKRIFDMLVGLVPDDAVVLDVSVGIFWTYVRTQYGSAVSATAHRWIEDPPGAVIPMAGELCGQKVRAISGLYDSASLTARSLANAAVSASFPSSEMTGTRIPGRAQDILTSLCSRERRHIALIGHFHFADDLRECGHTLDIYELEGRCEPDDIPSSRIPELLPRADIVLMTSSTILTHATEEILSCCHKEACKMIVGPTVPLHPCLWAFGFDAICGSVIHDDEQVSRAVREGGNHKQLTGCEKVNFMRPAV
ncbi:MAG: hypothetical protein IJM59_12365 [Proteobacteria bacterium]|nr:hypothetical protein [Pseudomonadota bacterium]